ncbi:hypothetical protein IKE71_03100 [Candidatus Saccharibacteria bacterium]|nr:hypothetical protein [Candidatus Saccharibacteria bacterium]
MLHKSGSEYNPFKIIWFCRWNIVSGGLIFVFGIVVIIALVMGCLAVSLPNYFNYSGIFKISDFTLGGVSIIFAILSARAYGEKDLALLYSGGASRKDKRRIPRHCDEEIKMHFSYYSYIAEYYLVTVLWAGILFCYEIGSVIVLGNDELSNLARIILCIFYFCATNLFLLMVVELIIKTFSRVTNKVKVSSTFGDRNDNVDASDDTHED